MKKHLSIYKTFDIVIVPFPFTDIVDSKNRPAIVLSNYESFNRPNEQCVLAMITSFKHSKWSLDTEIMNLQSCGLLKPSIIRLKMFTIDNILIKSKIGQLSKEDQSTLKENIFHIFTNFII